MIDCQSGLPDRLHALFEVGLSLCYLSRWAEAEEVAAALGDFAAGAATGAGACDALPATERDDLLALARLGLGDYARPSPPPMRASASTSTRRPRTTRATCTT